MRAAFWTLLRSTCVHSCLYCFMTVVWYDNLSLGCKYRYLTNDGDSFFGIEVPTSSAGSHRYMPSNALDLRPLSFLHLHIARSTSSWKCYRRTYFLPCIIIADIASLSQMQVTSAPQAPPIQTPHTFSDSRKRTPPLILAVSPSPVQAIMEIPPKNRI